MTTMNDVEKSRLFLFPREKENLVVPREKENIVVLLDEFKILFARDYESDYSDEK